MTCHLDQLLPPPPPAIPKTPPDTISLSMTHLHPQFTSISGGRWSHIFMHHTAAHSQQHPRVISSSQHTWRWYHCACSAILPLCVAQPHLPAPGIAPLRRNLSTREAKNTQVFPCCCASPQRLPVCLPPSAAPSLSLCSSLAAHNYGPDCIQPENLSGWNMSPDSAGLP